MPVITKPTRFPPNDRNPPSLLDHIWSSHLSIHKSGIILHDITDLCPTFYQFILKLKPGSNNSKIRIYFRLNNDVSRHHFRTSWN